MFNFINRWLEKMINKLDEAEAKNKLEAEKEKSDIQSYDYKMVVDVDKIAMKYLNEFGKEYLKTETSKIGMYHMEKYEAVQRDHSVSDNIRAFHWLMGIVCQGRAEEFHDIQQQILDESCVYKDKVDDNFVTWFKANSPILIKALMIAKKYEDAEIGYDIKVGETLGQYFDKKISKNKTFMKIYNMYLNPDSSFV